MQYYSETRKDSLPWETTWVNPEGIMLCEVSQAEKGKYCIDLTYVCQRKKHELKEAESAGNGGGGGAVCEGGR